MKNDDLYYLAIFSPYLTTKLLWNLHKLPEIPNVRE